MTAHIQRRNGNRVTRVLPYLLLFFLFLSLVFSREVMNGVQHALSLSARVIIPSLFPFMVLSELLGEAVCRTVKERKKQKGLLYSFFGVSDVGMSAFFLGALCGFPLGVKHARTLLDGRAIEESECKRLICFSNNTGPAFVIAGVGGTLFRSVKLGVVLYTLQIIAALIVGLLFARIPGPSSVQSKKALSMPVQAGGGLVGAVRRSTCNIIYVCGLVVFFSALCSLIGVFCKNENLLTFIYPFLEVGGACNLAASGYPTLGFPAVLSTMLAISFGGASVHMQAALFFEGTFFPTRRYLSAKLLQAVFSCLLLYFVFPFI